MDIFTQLVSRVFPPVALMAFFVPAVLLTETPVLLVVIGTVMLAGFCFWLTLNRLPPVFEHVRWRFVASACATLAATGFFFMIEPYGEVVTKMLLAQSMGEMPTNWQQMFETALVQTAAASALATTTILAIPFFVWCIARDETLLKGCWDAFVLEILPPAAVFCGALSVLATDGVLFLKISIGLASVYLLMLVLLLRQSTHREQAG